MRKAPQLTNAKSLLRALRRAKDTPYQLSNTSCILAHVFLCSTHCVLLLVMKVERVIELQRPLQYLPR